MACDDQVCPFPPDVNLRACWAKMPCPDPPDRRVLACNTELVARVVKIEADGGDSLIVVSVGSDNGVTHAWHAVVLDGISDHPLAHGEVTLVRVDKRETVGRVHLKPAALTYHTRVRLLP
jgi:hypothetical protein